MPIFKLLITFSSQEEWETWAKGRSKEEISKVVLDIFPPEDKTKSVDKPFRTVEFKPDNKIAGEKIKTRHPHQKIKWNHRCLVCKDIIPKNRIYAHDTCSVKCGALFSCKKSYFRHFIRGISEKAVLNKTIEYFDNKYQKK